MLVSDPCGIYICKHCGRFANPPWKKSLVHRPKATCPVCDSSLHVKRVTIPFACKLLLQELQGMHIGVNLT